MQISFEKKEVCDKVKLTGSCPSCSKQIVLDGENFSKSPNVITCYKCRTGYSVLKTSDTKRFLMVDVSKVEMGK